VSLAHLYRHFLDYQNHLDAKAAELDAQGGDGSWLRNHLQAALQFSDDDFAQIRQSSARLTAALKTLDEQAVAIWAGGKTPSSHAQQKTLAAQREAVIQSEIDRLAQALSPQKKAALDAFITQLFAPKNLVFQLSSTGSPAPAEVQQ
jgi:transglutaminase/protease-like cytokinesis protein 3